VELAPIVQFADFFFALPKIKMKIEGLVLQMGLNKD
jgi:hypothetical protein